MFHAIGKDVRQQRRNIPSGNVFPGADTAWKNELAVFYRYFFRDDDAMLFENKKRQGKIVSDFFSGKYDDDIVASFIEKVRTIDRNFSEGKLSSPLEKEVFSTVEAKLFVDHLATIIAASEKCNKDEERGRFCVLQSFRDDAFLLDNLYEYYLYAHAALLKACVKDENDGGLKVLDREDFSRILDILMSYVLLK